MQARIPQQPGFPPHQPSEPSLPLTAEQVVGTRPVPVAFARPRVIGDEQVPVSAPKALEVPKKRLRRAHTIFGLIIASLFAFYLAWTVVRAARDVESEKSVPGRVIE